MASIKVILFGWRQARNAILISERDLARGPKTQRRRVLNEMARESRNLTKRNITTQGGGKWKQLSKWTRARTGRRKALVTMRPFVKAKLAGSKALRSAVIFQSPGDYTLTQHHVGFVEPAAEGPFKIPLKRPKLLGLRGKAKSIRIRRKKASVVPARPVWPEGRPLRRIINGVLLRWSFRQNQRIQKAARTRR